MDHEEFEKRVESDWWLYGKDAIEFNAADKLVNVYCVNDLYDIKDNIEHDTFFGIVNIKFSRCPLVQYPLEIESSFNIDDNIKSEIESKIMNDINNKYNTGLIE